MNANVSGLSGTGQDLSSAQVAEREAADAGRAGGDRPPRVVAASLLGTTVEYYDFAIYGFMATFLAVNFFPAGDETAALLTTFGTFAVAFLVRLPGGIVFGHIGDRLGRKRALSITIIMMSGATALIGLAPSYATLGIWAAAVLIFCRCVQGFSAGGEYSGAVAFVAENPPVISGGGTPRWSV